MLLLALMGSAVAQDSWSFPEDETRTWYIESTVTAPVVRRIGSDGDRWSVRILTTRLRLVSTCTKVDQTAQGTELSCEIEDAAMLATRASSDDAASLQAALDELDQKLTGARLQVIQDETGAVRHLDLEGVATEDVFQRSQQEFLRQLLRRAWAGFDLSLQAREQWSNKDVLLGAPPMDVRWTGTSTLLYEATPLEGGTRQLTSEGQGTIEISDYERRLALRMRGSALVGPDGVVLQHRWAAVGQPTSSSNDAVISSGMPYHQGGFVQLLGEDRPDLGPTGPWEQHWTSGRADDALMELQVDLEREAMEGPVLREPSSWWTATTAATWRLDQTAAPGLGLGLGHTFAEGLSVHAGLGFNGRGHTVVGWPVYDLRLEAGAGLDMDQARSPYATATAALVYRVLPKGQPRSYLTPRAVVEAGGRFRLPWAGTQLDVGLAVPYDLRGFQVDSGTGASTVSPWGLEPRLSLRRELP